MTGDTRVAALTPSGTGAIATVEVSGNRAWEVTRGLFRPAVKPLPERPELHRFWFGTLGAGAGDEVIVAVVALEPEMRVEVHCHGGRRVVRWVLEQFIAKGCIEATAEWDETNLEGLLSRAPTLRTAAILLDQARGAFAEAIGKILEDLPNRSLAAAQQLDRLARYAPIGRHLIEPWKVAIVGPPNVGKSSLTNALAGFQRTIVSEVAGTTRDVVTVRVAFEGWPVELADTAGLRAAEGLEAEGIERARRALSKADLAIWVLDGSRNELEYPDAEIAALIESSRTLMVLNKVDQLGARTGDLPLDAIRVSAAAGLGIKELCAAIAARLIGDPPPAGAAVPYCPRLCDLVSAAYAALQRSEVDAAIGLLRDCQTIAGYKLW